MVNQADKLAAVPESMEADWLFEAKQWCSQHGFEYIKVSAHSASQLI